MSAVLRAVGHEDGFTVAKAIIELHKMAGVNKLPDGTAPTFGNLAGYLHMSESTVRRLYRSTRRTDGNKGRAKMRLGTVPDDETADMVRKLVDYGYRACAYRYGMEMARDARTMSDMGRIDEANERYERAKLLKDLAFQHLAFFPALKGAGQQTG